MTPDVIRIAVGHDTRETIATKVAFHSLIRRSSLPLQLTPIALANLGDLFVRDIPASASTEFSFSRFLTPYLFGFDGWAIFMDGDVLALKDIAELWRLRDDRYAVMCVKHDHRPTHNTKFLGQAQTTYEKKNWSSVMLMNCRKCKALTPEYVNQASGLELHRFHWLESEELIGELPPIWNHLVGYSDGEFEDQGILHWTEGGPYFSDYADTKWANHWFAERDHMSQVIEKKLDSDV